MGTSVLFAKSGLVRLQPRTREGRALRDG